MDSALDVSLLNSTGAGIFQTVMRRWKAFCSYSSDPGYSLSAAAQACSSVTCTLVSLEGREVVGCVLFTFMTYASAT